MKNKLNEVIAIIAVPLLFFSILSFFEYPSKYIKQVDFLALIRKSQTMPTEKYLPQTTVSIADSTNDSDYAQIIPDTGISYFGSLTNFIDAVKSLKDSSENFHIAYFGDSMIEGDLITQDIRKSLQSKYGGSGVGFVPVTSITSKFRTSIVHDFNSGWTGWNFKEAPPKDILLGPAGYVFKGRPGAEVVFKSTKEYKEFGKVDLLLAPTKDVVCKLDCDSVKSDFRLNSDDMLLKYNLFQNGSFHRMKMKVEQGTPLIYGFNFENGNGIYLDNYSFRGSSGIPLSGLNSQLLQEFGKVLHYKLIILHYGLNVVSHKGGDYAWFVSGFKKTVRNIKNAFPNADILLVSVGDKSYHFTDGWSTEPDIPKFVEIQARIAAEEKVAFWNLYKAMGGYNTMKKWVEEEKPKLGNLDYTHPNHFGATKIASLIYSFLQQQIDIHELNATKNTTKTSLNL